LCNATSAGNILATRDRHNRFGGALWLEGSSKVMLNPGRTYFPWSLSVWSNCNSIDDLVSSIIPHSSFIISEGLPHNHTASGNMLLSVWVNRERLCGSIRSTSFTPTPPQA
jgi:hypothetical protein